MDLRALFKYGRKTVKVYDDGSDWQFVSNDGEQWFTKHSHLAESISLLYALDKYTSGSVKLTELDYL